VREIGIVSCAKTVPVKSENNRTTSPAIATRSPLQYRVAEI
jgi:hypothetical protein